MSTLRFRSLLVSGVLLAGGNTEAQWEAIGPSGGAYAVEVHQGALYARNQNMPLLRSVDQGDNWTEVNTGISDASTWWLTSVQGALFCGTEFGPAFRSTDEGATWQDIGLSGGVRNFVEHNDTLYACQWYNGAVVFSADGGDTWQGTAPFSSGFLYSWPMISVGDDLLVGARSSGVWRIGHSSDTWAYTGHGMTSPQVYSFAKLGTVLFAGTGDAAFPVGGVNRSTDLGFTWSASGLPNRTVYALHAMDGMLYAGTATDGVYMSADTGATWTAINTGLSDLEVVRLTSDGTYLYAGTANGGLFRYGLSTGVEETRFSSFPVSAFPVPCDRVLTTSVHLHEGAELSAQLIDAAGKVVAQRRVGPFPTGTHTLTWEVEALVPGLYTCRVISGAQRGSVRVVVE